MRRSSLKKLVSLFLALTLSLSLAACTPSQQEALTVYYGISSAWDALMPYNSVSGSNYARMIYDKLYDRLAYVHADGTLSPRAAKSWEGSEDGHTALFHLDEKAAFHDGTPVTAEHWVETFTLMTDPACPVLGRGNFSVFTGTDPDGCRVEGETFGVKAEDDYTLKLTFKTPTTPEDFLLDKNREFYVLPTHLLEGTDPAELMELDLWKEPVGSGPCKFVEELPGSQLTLAANKDYQLGAPGFDLLVITVMDKSNLLTALIAGDLDYYAIGGSLSAEDAPLAESSGVTVLEGTVPNTFFELMLNGSSIPDARVRRASGTWRRPKPCWPRPATTAGATPWCALPAGPVWPPSCSRTWLRPGSMSPLRRWTRRPCSPGWPTAPMTWASPAIPPAPCPCGSLRAVFPPPTTSSTWPI